MSARLGLVKPLSGQILALVVRLRVAVQDLLQFPGAGNTNGGDTYGRLSREGLSVSPFIRLFYAVMFIPAEVNKNTQDIVAQWL